MALDDVQGLVMRLDRYRLDRADRTDLRQHFAGFAPWHSQLSRRYGHELVENLNADGSPQRDEFLGSVGLDHIRRQQVEDDIGVEAVITAVHWLRADQTSWRLEIINPVRPELRVAQA